MTVADRILRASDTLRDAVASLHFGPPVTHVYNPLVYAALPWRAYVTRYGNSPKRCLYLGMNPGPFGMAQIGIPFGAVRRARGWLGIEEPVGRPHNEHPRRRVEGFQCRREEVSGDRLWGLFEQLYGSADEFFGQNFVLNYCPLLLLESSGRNRTPDSLPAQESRPLYAACDASLREVLGALSPAILIGVGAFAERRLEAVAPAGARVGRILHPSPASPAANRGFGEAATAQLRALGALQHSG